MTSPALDRAKVGIGHFLTKTTRVSFFAYLWDYGISFEQLAALYSYASLHCSPIALKI